MIQGRAKDLNKLSEQAVTPPPGDNSLVIPPLAELSNMTNQPVGNMKAQALRSASEWSLGRLKTESSILSAYRRLISNSQRYIYIENQFFISSSCGLGVENDIADLIFDRIVKAHREGAPFKVIVFIPLMPAFEANLEDQQGKVMQVQIGLQNLTIAKADKSLLRRLEAAAIPADNYVMFCSLRTWQQRPSDGKPITELVYIHSKVNFDH